MCRVPRIVRAVLVACGALVLLIAVVLVFSLALPVGGWRTGEPAVPPLQLAPGRPLAAKPLQVWIDTDAACGRSSQTDPDDCLAILLLMQAEGVEVVGVSTVFGNAPIEVTDATTRALIAELGSAGVGTAPVYRGAAEPADAGGPLAGPVAREGLRAALAARPLVIVALGPLTNIVAALGERPDLQARVTGVVAVMGRRRGHLFHPVEGGTAPSLLGHGPVLSDFNFKQDPVAATALLGMRLPLTLIPYEAAREVTLSAGAFDRMEAHGGPAAWVARRARRWLGHWRDDIGIDGFYPFDALAAGYAIEPSLLRCADVSAWVGKDAGVLGWLGAKGLFVAEPGEPMPGPIVNGHATYCPETAGLGAWLQRRLTAMPRR